MGQFAAGFLGELFDRFEAIKKVLRELALSNHVHFGRKSLRQFLDLLGIALELGAIHRVAGSFGINLKRAETLAGLDDRTPVMLAFARITLKHRGYA
jgi:hypothetical protein